MKTNGRSLLLYLLVLILFSCNTTKNSSQKTETVTSAEKEVKEKVVTPVVVKPNETEKPKTEITKPEVEVTKPEIEKPPKKEEENKSDDTVSASSLENEMITELNRLRKNPAGYIADIQEYLVYFEKNNFQDLAMEKRTANELIGLLKITQPLQELSFDQDLYKIAVKHGKDIKSRQMQGVMNPHVGSDGSDLTQRVKGLTNMKGQTENVGTSHENAKYQIISLLIDAGVSTRAHRRNILDPHINVVAPYHIGTIADFPGCWIQLFGNKVSSAGDAGNKFTSTLTFADAKKIVDASNMTAEEKEMMNEINMLRSNPKGYIPHIEAYLVKVNNGEIWSMTTPADETRLATTLIKQLKTMAPLSVLKYDAQIYDVAKTHGQYLKANGYKFNPPVSPHLGANGKGADARITNATSMTMGGENIQGTNLNVRETLIGLLIDAGIPDLGHRKALINPNWNHGACHFFGPVPMDIGKVQEKNWIQNFGAK